MKTGLLKYIVRPPNRVINIPPTRGIFGIFFSNIQTINRAIIVAIMNGGIATFKSFPLS